MDDPYSKPYYCSSIHKGGLHTPFWMGREGLIVSASNHPLTSPAGLSIDMGSSDARAELGVFLVQEQN